MKKKVLLPERIHPIGSTYLEERGYELLYGSCEPEVIMKKLPECQAVITRNAKITREMMEGAPSLRVIARHGVGVDLIDTDSAAELGIWVTNAPQSNTNSVAEQVIGAMLSVARHFYPCQTMISQGSYHQRTQICGMELCGKTLGIIGFGRIGYSVARKASLGLNMNILVYDPFQKPKALEYPIQLAGTLKELLEASDVVSLHAPLLSSNYHMIGREQFSWMKEGAILINYAREAFIDADALWEAVAQGKLAGAALDVFEEEPILPENPLAGLPQVLLTPHTASFTEESLKNMALHSAMTVHQVLSGQIPSWYVVAGAR